MRFLLAFVLSFISVFAIAQAPPMIIGGPQGISVTRINAQNWMALPIYVDTPVAPLTSIGWPPRGFMIQTIKNYREATLEEWVRWTEITGGGLNQIDSVTWEDNNGTRFILPLGIDSSQILNHLVAGDTAIWHYTGREWKRVGGNAEFYFNSLVEGGFVQQVLPLTTRRFNISNSEYIIKGVRYKYDTIQTLIAPPKTPDSTGRIDVIVLTSTGARLFKGEESKTPYKPRVGGDAIELTSIYYKPFDTIPNNIGSGQNGLSNLYRVPGIDSIFYTIDTLTFSIKDSIGISKNDTASMLNPYKFTAANGLTKDSTVFRLGGSLNQNTSINLNTRRLTIIGGADTTRFFAGGQVSIGGTPDSNTVHHLVNRKNSRLGNLEILSGSSASITGVGIRVDGVDQTFKFQGTNQSATGTTFQFSNWLGDTVPASVGQPHLLRDIIRVSQGYVMGAGAASVDTGRYNVLNIEPKYNIWYDSGRTLIRGIYYNPTIQALNKTNHVAYQNTTGSNLMNSISGNTRIGYNTFDTTYKLDVNGSANIQNILNFGGTTGNNIRITGDGNPIGGSVADMNELVAIGSGVGNSLQPTGGGSMVAIGVQAALSMTTGGRYSVIIGRNAGRGITTGGENTIIGANDATDISPSTSNAIHLIAGGGYESNRADTTLLGLTSNYAFIGGGFGAGGYISDFYLGGGNRVRRPDFANINLYAPSAYPTKADTIGSNFTINAGRGTGTGLGGSVIFRTSPATTSGTTLQTLAERARITPAGNLLVGTATDNGYRVSAVGGTIAGGVYGRGYIPFKADYINDGNTIFSVGTTSDTSVVSIRHGSISESYRVLRIFGTRSGEEVRVNGTNGANTNQDTTALFEIVSTNAGFLQPRMTNVQRDSISSIPTQGLQVFSTTDSANYVYRGTGGGWQKIANEISGSATLDFPSTGHGNSADLTITVTGASEGDVVALGIPNASIVANASFTAWVSATDTVTVRFNNYASSGNSDPASGTFKIKVLK